MKTTAKTQIRKPQPRLMRLGKFIHDSIHESGSNAHKFSQQFGLKSSSLSEIIGAKTCPSAPLFGKIASALTTVTGKPVTVQHLLDLIDDPASLPEINSKSNTVRVPAKAGGKADLSSPKVLLEAMQRLSRAQRQTIWADVVRIGMHDLANPSPISEPSNPLRDEVIRLSECWNVALPTEFVALVLDKAFLKDSHPDRELLTAVVVEILQNPDVMADLESKNGVFADPKLYRVMVTHIFSCLFDGAYQGSENLVFERLTELAEPNLD